MNIEYLTQFTINLALSAHHDGPIIDMHLLFSSQGVEQLNRELKQLATSVSYMTEKNFRLTLSVFMAGKNFLRLKKENQPNQRRIDAAVAPAHARALFPQL